jgi:hypothetical protein
MPIKYGGNLAKNPKSWLRPNRRRTDGLAG